MRNTTLSERGKGCFEPPPCENGLTQFNPDWLIGGAPNRWDNHFSPNIPQLGVASASRRPHLDIGDQRFWCKTDLNWPRQLSWLVTNVCVQADRVLTIHLRKSQADIVRVQLSINNLFGRRCTTHPSRTSGPQCAVLNCGRLVPFQCHHGTHMVARHEGHPIYVYQMVSYLTTEGQFNLFGSQLATRQCY